MSDPTPSAPATNQPTPNESATRAPALPPTAIPRRDKRDPDAERVHREIVSFVRRGDRLSPSRQRAWNRLSARYVLDPPRGERDTLLAEGAAFDLTEEFGRRAPLVVEIGTGQGENLVAAAAADPDRDYLGVDVYVPGLAQTLHRLERSGMPSNVRLLPLDAQRGLPALLPERSISELWVYFPDPWPKQRHHKRRIINPPFCEAVLPLLAEGAPFRLATDWAQYAHHMREVLDKEPSLSLMYPDGPRPEGETSDPVPTNTPETGWAPRFEGRVKTSFENKGRRAGRLVWDLAYLCTPPRASERR